MSSDAASPPPSTLSIFLSLAGIFFVGFFLLRLIADHTLLPAVRRHHARMLRDHRQQLDHQQQLHVHLQNVRSRARAAAAADRRRRETQWAEDMAERDRRTITALQAHEPSAVRREGGKERENVRRQVAETMALLEAMDEAVKTAEEPEDG